ncbi:MAG TPA: hypothetical protein VM425_08180 [Myxococcota bacterium]|nr:hypothetical protein [Myxococcota bacterium]
MLLLLIVSLFGFTPNLLYGHKNPRGDVHPIVLPNDGNFAVYFYASVEKEKRSVVCPVIEREFPPHRNVYKMVISPSGKVISERTPACAPPKATPPPFCSLKTERIASVRSGEDWYIIPQWDSAHKGKPRILKVSGEKEELIEIKWDSRSVFMVHDLEVDDDRLVLLVTFHKNKKPNQYLFREQVDVVFVAKGNGAILGVTSLGSPARFTFFPVVTKILNYHNFWFLAYVDKASRLILVKFGQDFAVTKQQVVSQNVTTNNHLSISRIGSNTLLAFQQNGKIEYLLFDAETW